MKLGVIETRFQVGPFAAFLVMGDVARKCHPNTIAWSNAYSAHDCHRTHPGHCGRPPALARSHSPPPVSRSCMFRAAPEVRAPGFAIPRCVLPREGDGIQQGVDLAA